MVWRKFRHNGVTLYHPRRSLYKYRGVKIGSTPGLRTRLVRNRHSQLYSHRKEHHHPAEAPGVAAVGERPHAAPGGAGLGEAHHHQKGAGRKRILEELGKIMQRKRAK